MQQIGRTTVAGRVLPSPLALTNQVETGRRYRCHYTPRDALGHLNPSDTGATPFVQLRATDAEDALTKAHHVTGCPVTEAIRIEG